MRASPSNGGDAALRQSEERFRALVLAGSYAVYRMSPEWDRMYRLDGRDFLADTRAPDGDWMQGYILEEDQPVVAEVIARAVRDGTTFELEHRVRRADGGVGWTLSRAVPIRDDTGAVVEWFGTASDVSARREAEETVRRSEERLTLLVAELQHRTRNLLAVVSGVADQTRATAPSLEAFGAAFDRRLAALGRVQGLLSVAPAPAVELAELVRLELAAHGAVADGKLIRVDGAAVRLSADAVQMLALALALHELATNAVKHGALAQGGRLEIGWTVADERGDGPVLRLDWREQEIRVEPPERRRRGFGSELIEVELPHELDADTRLDLTDGGVHCRIAFALR